MQPRVTAIVVARNGERTLADTLEALRAQSRPVDSLLAIDAGSSDDTARILSSSGADTVASAPAVPYGEALAIGARALRPTSSADEWLWLLSHDTPPALTALAELLAAVEIAPSVAVAGPKVTGIEDTAVLRSYGISLSRFGATVPLLDSELDQGQYDREEEVLGVSARGMLVRRSVWDALGGLDPGLPSADAGLDLSVRARLAGHRVVRVPRARVAQGSAAWDFGRRRPAGRVARTRIARAAELHRRFVYAPAFALPVHWLALLPLALARSAVHLLAKRPGAVPGELAAAVGAAVADPSVAGSRRRLRRARTTGWAAIAPLRVPPADLRRRRASARERAAEGREVEAPLVRAEFFSGGGIWVVVAATLIGIGAFWRLLGAAAIEGGGLLPLGPDAGRLWAQALSPERTVGVGSVGPGDPFALLLAVLGTLSFPSPSAGIVVLWLAALPLAALGGWWCATRLTDRRAGPAVAGLLWALAPPFLVALGDGRIGAVIAHLALPWLVLAAIEGRRSWSAAATASLLFAVTAASAPSLTPALLVSWFAWLALNPRAIIRLIGIPIPAVVLFAPLVLAQLRRGTPLALLADPGVPLPFLRPSGWDLAIGEPAADSSGWGGLAAAAGLPPAYGGIAAAILLAPLAALALATLFLPGSRRGIGPLLLALLGLVSAAAALRVLVSTVGPDAVAVWPGPALSLYWLGIVGAAVAGLRAVGRLAAPAAVAVVVVIAGLSAPVVAAAVLGATRVQAGEGRTLPALVAASAASRPRMASLVLEPQRDGSLRADLQNGGGETLDEQSTLVATRRTASSAEREIAVLAGNLASRSGYDPVPALRRYSVGFVVLAPASDPTPAAAAVRERAASALDSTAVLRLAAESTDQGALWQVPDARAARAAEIRPSALDRLLQLALAVVTAVALLLAIPTRRRRQVVSEVQDELQADTFAEDVDD